MLFGPSRVFPLFSASTTRHDFRTIHPPELDQKLFVTDRSLKRAPPHIVFVLLILPALQLRAVTVFHSYTGGINLCKNFWVLIQNLVSPCVS